MRIVAVGVEAGGDDAATSGSKRLDDRGDDLVDRRAGRSSPVARGGIGMLIVDPSPAPVTTSRHARRCPGRAATGATTRTARGRVVVEDVLRAVAVVRVVVDDRAHARPRRPAPRRRRRRCRRGRSPSARLRRGVVPGRAHGAERGRRLPGGAAPRPPAARRRPRAGGLPRLPGRPRCRGRGSRRPRPRRWTQLVEVDAGMHPLELVPGRGRGSRGTSASATGVAALRRAPRPAVPAAPGGRASPCAPDIGGAWRRGGPRVERYRHGSGPVQPSPERPRGGAPGRRSRRARAPVAG